MHELFIHHKFAALRVNKDRSLEHSFELDGLNFDCGHHIVDLNAVVEECGQVQGFELLKPMRVSRGEFERNCSVFYVILTKDSKHPETFFDALAIETCN